MRLAGDAITHMAKGAWEQFQKQHRVTQYFEKHEDANITRGGKPKLEEVRKR
jgi:hypothetical protein